MFLKMSTVRTKIKTSRHTRELTAERTNPNGIMETNMKKLLTDRFERVLFIRPLLSSSLYVDKSLKETYPDLFELKISL